MWTQETQDDPGTLQSHPGTLEVLVRALTLEELELSTLEGLNQMMVWLEQVTGRLKLATEE